MPIPDHLQKIFGDLQLGVLWTHIRWQMFRQVFLHSKLRLDLLDETAGAFFHFTRFAFLGETVLAITRLTDPPEMGQHENCVLKLLIDRLDGDEHEAIKASLTNRLPSIKTCEPLRQRRHKHLAHHDRHVALASSDVPFRMFPRK